MDDAVEAVARALEPLLYEASGRGVRPDAPTQAARAALAALDAAGLLPQWRPIDSAPLNEFVMLGRRILAHERETLDVETAIRLPPHPHQEWIGPIWMTYYGHVIQKRFTHWMPLPALPNPS
jgi:hypothetical protein